jgi:hypothetical protein
MSRLLRSLVVALILWVGLVPGARASEQWCEDDPPVVIVTPGGAAVPLYVTNAGLGLQHLVAVQTAKIEYTVTPATDATIVHMRVTIPRDRFDDHFRTRTTTSTGPHRAGVILADAQGFSGQTMRMQFRLNVP